jgi:hypothetical protein
MHINQLSLQQQQCPTSTARLHPHRSHAAPACLTLCQSMQNQPVKVKGALHTTTSWAPLLIVLLSRSCATVLHSTKLKCGCPCRRYKCLARECPWLHPMSACALSLKPPRWCTLRWLERQPAAQRAQGKLEVRATSCAPGQCGHTPCQAARCRPPAVLPP